MMKTVFRLIIAVTYLFMLNICFNIYAYADEGSYSIPENTISIENEAFSNCAEMTDVRIPLSVTSIGNGAFADCDNLKKVYYDGTQAQWKNISIGADNASLNNAWLFFLGEQGRAKLMVVDGKEYRAVYQGAAGLPNSSDVYTDMYSSREFWHLENAYQDLKNCPVRPAGFFQHPLSENTCPMPLESGEIYVVDENLNDGGVLRKVMCCDGTIRDGMQWIYSLHTDAPIRTETMSIGGKEYTASYYGTADLSHVSNQNTYNSRDFWRLEGAYEDFRESSLTGNALLDRNFPMTIKAEQVFVIDYTLKNGSVSRELHRCDGEVDSGMFFTREFVLE